MLKRLGATELVHRQCLIPSLETSLLLYPDLREEKNQGTGLLCFVPSDLPLLGEQVLERWLTFSLPAFVQAVPPTWTVRLLEYPWP